MAENWDQASDILNKYVSENGGGDINWEKARAEFDKHASGDGNFGDWVNRTFDNKSAWVNSKSTNNGYTPPPNPSDAWNREAFRDRWQAQGTGQNLSSWLAANQDVAKGVRLVDGSQDKAILPSGEVMDLVTNSNNGVGGAGWTGAGGWNGTSIYQYPDSGSGGGNEPQVVRYLPSGSGNGNVLPPPSSARFLSSPSSSNSAPTVDPFRQQLVDSLMKRSQQSLAVDRNDPIVRAQADAYAANEERASRNYLADLAEREGPLANLRGETRMASERVGQATGGYEAELMGRELTARRTEIAQALAQMQGLLTSEQQMALQRELAQMDDAIARLKLEQDASQFDASMSYQNRALDQQGNLALRGMDQQNNLALRGLDQQGRIADNQLGYYYDQFDWDRSPMNPKNIPA